MKNILRKIHPLVVIYHFLFSFMGALTCGFPSRKIKVFGITGTNGKTTTVNIVSEVFKSAGYRVAAFSSEKFEINGKEEPNLYKMTMPGRAVLQKLLKKAVKENCDVAIMEVTSEGVKQYRHYFFDFEAVCITNLSPEHIESHGGFENYKEAKGKLFKACKKTHIVNIDDSSADYFLNFKGSQKICYGINGSTEDKENVDFFIKAEKVSSDSSGVRFTVENKELFLPLLGEFNVYNALVALSLLKKEKGNIDGAKDALKNIKGVPGRMDEVCLTPPSLFRVIVDYAVTPNALEGLYKELRANFNPQRIIAVFGSCGGGRDRWKRPVLGSIAEKYCDKIILTNEDPYNEDEEEIVNQIMEGVKNKEKVEIVLDRRSAINKALGTANKDDVVIVTGKGSEPWMCLKNGKKIPWSEKNIIKEEYNKIINI